MDEKSETRVRINLTQNAKGVVQFDITAEFPTEDETITHLGAAIDKTKAMCAEKGLKIAETAA